MTAHASTTSTVSTLVPIASGVHSLQRSAAVAGVAQVTPGSAHAAACARSVKRVHATSTGASHGSGTAHAPLRSIECSEGRVRREGH